MKNLEQRDHTHYFGGPIPLFVSLLGGIAALIACSGDAHAADTKAERPLPRGGCAISSQVLGTFNVKCFGAKGDGTTDDTNAIQAAATAAEQAVAVITPAGATYMGSGPPV